MPWVNAAGYKA